MKPKAPRKPAAKRGQSAESLARLTARCEQIVLEQSVRPHPCEFYQHLPLCILDSVFSINNRYESVEFLIERYCVHFSLRPHPRHLKTLPARSEQQPVAEMLAAMEEKGVAAFAKELLKNEGLTSTRSGVLKAEAAYQFGQVLRKYGVNYLQDLKKVVPVQTVGDTSVPVVKEAFENDILAITGQGSGISLKYFLMLTGRLDLVKPDRMIVGFLEGVMERPVSGDEAATLLTHASDALKTKYPNIVPALIDSALWRHQRAALAAKTEKA